MRPWWDREESELEEPRRPRRLSIPQAESTKRPRRCNVPWERQGGTLVCDLCACQYDEGEHVVCLSEDEPRLFRPRRNKERWQESA